MGQSYEYDQFDIPGVFRRAQAKMVADLAVGDAFLHQGTKGAASEQQWQALLEHYLPKRYRVSPAFVINASGQRSRQIDLAIYDNFWFSPIFPHAAGVHIPIESVYAILEVKAHFTGVTIQDAGLKAASVRALQPGRAVIAGILAANPGRTTRSFQRSLESALRKLPSGHEIDFGCILGRGSFECSKVEHPGSEPTSHLTVSERDETLIFLILRLLSRLSQMDAAPPMHLMRYGARVQSFRRLPKPAEAARGEEAGSDEEVIPLSLWRRTRK